MRENNELEKNALVQFVNLLDQGGSASSRVLSVIDLELTNRQRQQVVLYFKEGLTMTEIAKRLNISPSSVSRTISRGKNRLRKFLKYSGRTFLSYLDD